MIFFSSDLYLGPEQPLNTPIMAWQSLLTTGNVTATTEAEGYPASNLANPSTVLEWRGAQPSPAIDQYVTVLLTGFPEVDHLAIAVHNLGTAQIPVSVETATALVGSPPAPNWAEVIPDALLGSDEPVLYRFATQPLYGIRLRMQPGLEAPRIAVMYAGKLLVMPRGTHADHTPINLGRTTEQLTAKSQNGHFLGRLVLSESRATSIPFYRLEQDWYRTYMDPFIVASRTAPFFFAQRPQTRAADVGYVTMSNDPQPVVHFDTDTVAIDLQMSGVAVA